MNRLLKFTGIDLTHSITVNSTQYNNALDLVLTDSTFMIAPYYDGVQTLYTIAAYGSTVTVNQGSDIQGQEMGELDSFDEALTIRLFGGRPRPPQK